MLKKRQLKKVGQTLSFAAYRGVFPGASTLDRILTEGISVSIVKSDDGKKWINSFLAGSCLILSFISIRVVRQLGEWFDLEAKIKNFTALSQFMGLAVGILVFFIVIKNKTAMAHLGEVYDELVKVVWADKDTVVKITIGIVIGLSIVSLIFVAVDLSIQKVLSFIY